MADIQELKDTFFLIDVDPMWGPPPIVFENSRITPLIDASEYNQELEAALSVVTGPDGYILIADRLLGLAGGKYITPRAFNWPNSLGSRGPIDTGTPNPNPDPLPIAPYALDAPNGSKKLLGILAQKANEQVDIRVLGWMAYPRSGNHWDAPAGFGDAVALNAQTAASILALRKTPGIGSKAVLNAIGHPGGDIGCCLVIIGNDTDAIGFTGNLSLDGSRWGRPGHQSVPGPNNKPRLHYEWHGVMAMVQGPAVQGLFDLFQNMWAENLNREPRELGVLTTVNGKKTMSPILSYLKGVTPPSFFKLLPTTPKGPHLVQNLRTIPRFKYEPSYTGPKNPPLSFGINGVFEYRDALNHAIHAAQKYIYIEDRLYWSRDILGSIHSTVVSKPNLKVIMLYTGGWGNDFQGGIYAMACDALQKNLFKDLTAAQQGQIAMFERTGDSAPYHPLTYIPDSPKIPKALVTNRVWDVDELIPYCQKLSNSKYSLAVSKNTSGEPYMHMDIEVVWGAPPKSSPEKLDLWMTKGIAVNNATVLIDDQWAVISSGHIADRTLLTDIHHSVSFSDPAEMLVKQYREALWMDLFKSQNSPVDINGWLNSWLDPAQRPPFIVPIEPWKKTVPPAALDMKFIYEFDSTFTWGGAD
jgi:phosphatidylserine/phosphatidylglycerophosphate/cardiolipin synthase-like enzyme